MKADLTFGRKSVQLILWGFDPEEREHWGFGYGRWPTGATMAGCVKAGWKNFGFHGFVVGPFEIRYWPETIKR